MHTTTSGIEGAWKPNPTKWDNGYFDMLFGYEWELAKSPAGAQQWLAKDVKPEHMIPDAHDPSKKHRADDDHGGPVAALRPDLRADRAPLPQGPGGVRGRLRPRLVQADPPRHGARSRRYLGPEVPAEDLIWQDPIPGRRSRTDRCQGHCRPQGQDPGLRPVHLGAGLHRLGLGVHLPRLGQARRRQRRAHSPGAAEGLGGQPAAAAGQGAAPWKASSRRSTRATGGKKVSLADLIVLGGCAAIEAGGQGGRAQGEGALHAGPHRRLAGADGRGLLRRARAQGGWLPQLPEEGLTVPAEEMLVDRAQLLTLSAPEMTVLHRRLACAGRQRRPVEAWRVHQAGRDADQRLLCQPAGHGHGLEADLGGRRHFRGPRPQDRQPQVDATRVDLVFGSNSQLRALAEVYAQDNAKEKFVHDFVAAWNKVMNLDRFDLK